MPDNLQEIVRNYASNTDGLEVKCLKRSHESLMKLMCHTSFAQFHMPGLRGTQIPASYLKIEADISTFHEAYRRADQYSLAKMDEAEADLKHHLADLAANDRRSVLFGSVIALSTLREEMSEILIATFVAPQVTACVLRVTPPRGFAWL